jgi:hypothetical protein
MDGIDSEMAASISLSRMMPAVTVRCMMLWGGGKGGFLELGSSVDILVYI